MSELPPINDPNQPSWSAPPPPQYAGYTRSGSSYGDPDKLQALSDGYYGLNLAFVATLVLVLLSRVGAVALATVVPSTILLLVLVFGIPMILAGAISYPYNKKIAYGANWNPSYAILASVLMGINLLFCGIVGFVIMQLLAASEIKKYGIRSGFFGLRKKDIQATILQLRSAATVPQVPVPPPAN